MAPAGGIAISVMGPPPLLPAPDYDLCPFLCPLCEIILLSSSHSSSL